MSASDRSWTVAPALAWFAVFAAVGIVVVDGDVTALADRLTHPREPAAPGAAGPSFAPPPQVAVASEPAEVAPALPVGGAGRDRAQGGALEDVCLEGTPTACRRWAMDAFYGAVAKEKANTLGRAVRVSWYGDSVIASDMLPSRLRTKLQSALGNGGPGYVFVVEPHRFTSHEAVTRAHSGAWSTHAISTMQSADGLYGAGGSSTEATGASSATFKINGGGKAERVELYYLAQPRGGSAVLKADGAELAQVDTASEAKIARGTSATVTGGATKFSIETRGRVRLFGIGLENASGVVVDNFGIVSVNVKNFSNRDAENFAAELGHRGADLVMLQIGANEAHWLGPKDTAMAAYGAQYKSVLDKIRKALPNSSCLVIAPTDQAITRDTGYVSRPVMPVLVDAQRKAAHAAGCAYFATWDWMGGNGSAVKWFKAGLVGSDFTHLSRKGANKLTDGVYDALMAGVSEYAAYHARR